MNRWHSWGATAPLWATGLIIIIVGLVLVGAAIRSVRRGR